MPDKKIPSYRDKGCNNRVAAQRSILELTKKYNWSQTEIHSLNHILTNLARIEYDEGVIIGLNAEGMTDTQLLNKLQELVKLRFWKMSVNYDYQDGYFVEVYDMYSLSKDFPDVADLKLASKRKTIREALIAAVQYLSSN